jgi:hypothetical protein
MTQCVVTLKPTRAVAWALAMMLCGSGSATRAQQDFQGPDFFGPVGPTRPATAPSRPSTAATTATTASAPSGPATQPVSAPTTQDSPTTAPTGPTTRPPTRPGPSSQPAAPPVLSDERVRQAIRRGLDHLYNAQKADGTWNSRYAVQYPGGTEALVLLAALSAGESIERNGVLRSALIALNQSAGQTVYARAFRIMVYSRLGEPYAQRLTADVNWLILQQGTNGGWGYGPAHPITASNRLWTDNSNTQLAMLALRDAAEAGATVPAAVWRRARGYWQRAQNADGGWGYDPPGLSSVTVRIKPNSYGSMSAAGAASVYILSDMLAEATVPPATRPAGPTRPTTTHPTTAGPTTTRPATAPASGGDREVLDGAIKWLALNYTVGRIARGIYGEEWLYYYHWCLARACTAGGLRDLGGNDWYADLATVLLSRQLRDGTWPDPAGTAVGAADAQEASIRTCMAILALSEGQKGVLINKLDLEDPWGPDCRDAAGLTVWLSGAYKRPLTWQRLSPEATLERFREAPILYVNAQAPVALSEALSAKIRDFVLQGGTVLVQAGPDPDLVERLQAMFLGILPHGFAGKLSPQHPVFDLIYKIPPDTRPEVIGIGERFRTRVFIVTDDLAGAWHRGDHLRSPAAFQFAANLGMYATDASIPTGKLASRREVHKTVQPGNVITVPRLRHAGDWNACPMAMPRLSEVLAAAVSLGVREGAPLDFSKEAPAGVPLVWMTGSTPTDLAPEQRRNLKAYLEAGGMLFIDAAAGTREFADAAERMLQEVFGVDALRPVPNSHPLLTGAFAGGMGCNVQKISCTRALAAQDPKMKTPDLLAVEINGRLAVVFSPYGVTCPLEGGPAYGCLGLSTDDARRLAANVVLYAHFTQPARPTGASAERK